MLSNDMQIELESEEGYTAAIKRAQYALNGAAAGLLMDFALMLCRIRHPASPRATQRHLNSGF
jgi:hypothetical protein